MEPIFCHAVPPVPQVCAMGTDRPLRAQLDAMRRLLPDLKAANAAWLVAAQSPTVFLGPEGDRIMARMDEVSVARRALITTALAVEPKTLADLRDKAELAVLVREFRIFAEQDDLSGVLAGEVIENILDLV